MEDKYSPDRVDALVWAITELTGSRYYGNIDLRINEELIKTDPFFI